MADEQLAPTGELEPEAVVEETPVEETTEETTEQAAEQAAETKAEADRLEAIARRNGWRPKEEFRGNPDEWRDAEAYVEATFGIASAVKKKLATVESTVENMARTNAAILEQQIAERVAQLDVQRREAIEAGDVDAVNQIEGQRQQLQRQMPSQQQNNSTAAQAFIQRHSSWYGKDQEATDYAVMRAGQYGASGLTDPALQLEAVERDVRRRFPEHFPAPAKTPPRTSQPTRTATPSNRTKGFHDLPAEAQAVARDMVERGVIPSIDHYVKNWDFSGRKVG